MNQNQFNVDNAICYSGYRSGQSPLTNIFPTYHEVREDLLLLAPNFKYLRLYDPNEHAKLVLEVIRNEALDIKVMLGMCLAAEISNPNCPWGADYSDEQLAHNKKDNQSQLDLLANLANEYPDIIFSLSVGNEATVDWSDHIVPIDSIISYVKYIRKNAKQPITFCENYVPWRGKLDALVKELDFISLHTYPLWEYKSIEEAIHYSKENYQSVKERFPSKPIVITEAGWATESNGRGMNADFANEENQAIYNTQLLNWSQEEQILIFLFEAFDEDWKGSPDPSEPEKHWGIYNINRKPKLFMK